MIESWDEVYSNQTIELVEAAVALSGTKCIIVSTTIDRSGWLINFEGEWQDPYSLLRKYYARLIRNGGVGKPSGIFESLKFDR